MKKIKERRISVAVRTITLLENTLLEKVYQKI